MVLRSFVAVFHLLLAVATSVYALGWLAQARLNLAWELAFYDAPADATAYVIARSLVALGLAALQTGTAVAFVVGGRTAGNVMLMVSMMLAWSAPWPINAFLALAGLIGAHEVWMHLPAAPAAEEEEEED
jgi:hypothetical protein